MNTIRALAAVAHHHQPGVCLVQNACEDLDAINRSLHRAKIRHMDQYWIAAGSERLAQLAINLRLVFIGTDEIRNDLDAIELKMFDSRFLQIVRNRGDAVRLL